jgi:hypothetical protein
MTPVSSRPVPLEKHHSIRNRVFQAAGRTVALGWYVQRDSGDEIQAGEIPVFTAKGVIDVTCACFSLGRASINFMRDSKSSFSYYYYQFFRLSINLSTLAQ